MATLRYVWNQYASPLMLLLLLVAVVVGVAVGVGLARVRARRGKAPLSRGTYLVGVLLWLWLVGMVCVTLLGSRGIWGSGEVNLQLFLAWEEAWYAGDRTAWLYIVLNLALFLPLGVLLPLLETRFQKVTWVLGTAAVLSLAVELLQLVLRRGSADIDDWFLNVLGAFLGWCLLRFVLGLKKREKKAVGYLLPPVACALVFCGIALAYQAQPYGMLPMQSVERVEMSGVEVHTDCPLPDVGETAPVYYAAPWTEANCDEYARPLLTALGEDFDAMEAERSEYRVDYTDPVHHSSLQVLFLGGFYALYQNQSGATEPAPATASREEVLQKLRSLGIPLPDRADFSTEAEAYCFTADGVEDGVLYQGQVTCTYREDGQILSLSDELAAVPQSGEVSICPPEKAVEQVRDGKFLDTDGRLSAGRSVEEGGVVRSDIDTLTIQSITLAYLRDTKDYYQPVYAVKTDKGILYTLATQ